MMLLDSKKNTRSRIKRKIAMIKGHLSKINDHLFDLKMVFSERDEYARAIDLIAIAVSQVKEFVDNLDNTI